MADRHPTDFAGGNGIIQTAVKTKKPRKQAISGRFWAGRTYRRRIKDDHKIEKTLPTLIQTNETKKSTQIDAFFESKPKIDAFLKIDANAQRQEYKMAS